MTPMRRNLSLTALALATSLLLSACGGGSAGAPDIFPPTVEITSDTTGTAEGPVTFTFTFSEDVGTSFGADDILVTGGTAGTLERVSATQYTLVVTPPDAAAGTIQVSVSASSFSDSVGNLNRVSPTVAQAFNTGAPVVGGDTVLVDFDAVTPTAVNGYEGGEGSTVEAAPAGGSGNAIKVLRSGGQVYALAVVALNGNVPLAADRLTISARVFSPTAGIPMVIKLEGTGGSPSTGDIQANQAVVAGWQTLTWTVPAVNTSYNTLVLLPNLGTVDAPPGKAYHFDDIKLLAPATGGGTLTFSSGFAANARTIEGGAFGAYSGTNLTGDCAGVVGVFNAVCGTGSEGAPALAAADSYVFHYHQTTQPAPAFTYLYSGIYVQAPGLTTGLSTTADTPGLQLSGQTTINFTLGQNDEWFNSPDKNFAVFLTLGKLYDAGGPCNVKLLRVVTPTAAAASAYSVPLNSFAVAQNCGQAGLTAAAALAAAPISQVDFQADGGSAAVSDGTLTSGANFTVPTGAPAVYPTTILVKGGITFQ